MEALQANVKRAQAEAQEAREAAEAAQIAQGEAEADAVELRQAEAERRARGLLARLKAAWRGVPAVLVAILAGIAPATAAPLVLTCAIVNEGVSEREHHYPHEDRAKAIYAAENALAGVYFQDNWRAAALVQVEQICSVNPDAKAVAMPIIVGNLARSFGAPVLSPPSVILRQLHELGYPYGP